MRFLESLPRSVFFTGKGGVGKTSVACATAVRLADRGLKVLLVSTDPASNLDEVLGVRLSPEPTAVPGVPGLSASNLDPVAAATAYRDKVVGPYRGVLPAAILAGMEEQLSGACTTEIASFEAFSRLLADPGVTRGFDHVLFDTAPTGHTLRLMKLPAAWSGFLDTNRGGTSCLGPLAGLEAQRDLYQATVQALSDPGTTRVVLVSRPERSSLAEAERTRAEMADLGVSNLHLVVNGQFRATDCRDPLARAFESRGRDAMATLPAGLAALPRDEILLKSRAPMGPERLRELLEEGNGAGGPVAADALAGRPDRESRDDPAEGLPTFQTLVDAIAAGGPGVVMTMGKGGVGKTTLAARLARELAARGHAVHLTTTDPAGHIVGLVGGDVPGLRVSRIDPVAETLSYTEESLATAGRDLDPAGRALLEEDLRSPCTEEIAVFRAFARAVAEGEDTFVVIDTAPTGHTVLLLDATEAYHRQVEKTRGELPQAIRSLLPRLRDPAYTRAVIVTLPEATPVHEALALRDDLVRAGIQPFAWVVNQSLAPVAVTDPVLRARRRQEARYIEEVAAAAPFFAVVPWQAGPGSAGEASISGTTEGNVVDLRIEVLDFEGCPHAGDAWTLTTSVVEDLGLAITPAHVVVESEEAANRLGFPGSPTIRVNGEDVEPKGADVAAYACRRYEGGQGLPSRWKVEVGLLRGLHPRGLLFLCVANSARSQMAEGIARSLAPAGVEVFSAGSNPGKLNPLAVQALAEIGIDISGHFSKGMSEVPAARVDAVITLCAEEVCPAWLGRAHRLHWGLPDPAAAGGDDAARLQSFRDVRDELRRRLGILFR